MVHQFGDPFALNLVHISVMISQRGKLLTDRSIVWSDHGRIKRCLSQSVVPLFSRGRGIRALLKPFLAKFSRLYNVAIQFSMGSHEWVGISWRTDDPQKKARCERDQPPRGSRAEGSAGERSIARCISLNRIVYMSAILSAHQPSPSCPAWRRGCSGLSALQGEKVE